MWPSQNTCFSLFRAYTDAILAFPWSEFTHMHCLFSGNPFVDFIHGRMYLSTTSSGFITGQGDILQNAVPSVCLLSWRTPPLKSPPLPEPWIRTRKNPIQLCHTYIYIYIYIKSLYPDCVLVIQGLLTLSYWNRNHNHSVWSVRQLARLNAFL